MPLHSDVMTEAVPIAGPMTTSVSNTPAAAAARSAPATRRAATTSRKATVPTINYAYLHRDIKALAILAPTMVIALILAFIVFH